MRLYLPPPARVPAVRPAYPHKSIPGLLDVGGMPSFSAVDADLDLVDGAGAAPSVAANHMDAGRDRLGVVVGLGDNGLHPDHGDQFLVGVVW